jgi:hypothetical protein
MCDKYVRHIYLFLRIRRRAVRHCIKLAREHHGPVYEGNRTKNRTNDAFRLTTHIQTSTLQAPTLPTTGQQRQNGGAQGLESASQP